MTPNARLLRGKTIEAGARRLRAGADRDKIPYDDALVVLAYGGRGLIHRPTKMEVTAVVMQCVARTNWRAAAVPPAPSKGLV
jgi:hypothetical protein